MNILITGGAGFIGSHISLRLAKNGHKIFVLDNLNRKGSELNIPRLEEKGIKFIKGDVRFTEDFSSLPPVDLMIECSAEPSVMAGINSSPDYLFHSNLVGAYNCFEYARKHSAKVLFLSTSRIFPIKTLSEIPFVEKETRFEIADVNITGINNKGVSPDFPLFGARSLYGTTKLSAEMILEEYNIMYGTDYIINRCGVIAGPWQMGKVDQGVFALWIARHIYKKSLSYVGFGGEGKQVRDFLHVEDLLDLIEIQIADWETHKNKIYHVGGGIENSASLQELTVLAQKVTGEKIEIEKVLETRPLDLKYFVMDIEQTTRELGWKPKRDLEVLTQDVTKWIQENKEELRSILE